MKHFVPPRVDPFTNESPRYVAYCIAHGAASPAEQKAADEKKHGPHWMRPFVYWVGHRAEDWCKEVGTSRMAMGWAEHQRFDEWLAAKYPVSQPAAQQLVRKRANARSGS